MSVTHDLLSYFRIRLSDANDVSDGIVAIRAHNEIRPGQEEEV